MGIPGIPTPRRRDVRRSDLSDTSPPFFETTSKSSQEIDLRYHGGKTAEISIVNPAWKHRVRVLRCIENQIRVGMFRPLREKFMGSRAELSSPRIVVRHATRCNATHARRFQAGIYYGDSQSPQWFVASSPELGWGRTPIRESKVKKLWFKIRREDLLRGVWEMSPPW